jgi:hypothetical protein
MVECLVIRSYQRLERKKLNCQKVNAVLGKNGKKEKATLKSALKSLLKKQLANRQVLQNAEKLLCKYVI